MIKKKKLLKMNTKLSIIIPARNEEETIEDEILSLMPHINFKTTEIIVVDDHSTDSTHEIVRKISAAFSCVRIIRNEKTPGFANTLISGFEQAKGEFVLPVMADGCDEPATITRMLEKTDKGFDIVCGSRYMKGGGKVGGPKIQGCFSTFVGVSLHVFTGLPTRDVSNAFKMYRREILAGLNLKEKGFAISMEAALKFFFNGYRMCEVPTVWYGRKKGKSKFSLLKTLPYMKFYVWALFDKQRFKH